MVERTGGAAANLREQVSLKIKNEKPLLLQLHNFRKSHKKSEIGRLYRRMKQLDQSIPPLKYIGEEIADAMRLLNKTVKESHNK